MGGGRPVYAGDHRIILDGTVPCLFLEGQRHMDQLATPDANRGSRREFSNGFCAASAGVCSLEPQNVAARSAGVASFRVLLRCVGSIRRPWVVSELG